MLSLLHMLWLWTPAYAEQKTPFSLCCWLSHRLPAVKSPVQTQSDLCSVNHCLKIFIKSSLVCSVAALCAFVGMWAFNKLPRKRHAKDTVCWHRQGSVGIRPVWCVWLMKSPCILLISSKDSCWFLTYCPKGEAQEKGEGIQPLLNQPKNSKSNLRGSGGGHIYLF